MIVEKLPAYRIAFIRRVGPYGEGNDSIMEELKKWAASNQLLNEDAVILGIAQDNPETTRPEACRYDVCLVMSEGYVINNSHIKSGNIKGGKYAVFPVEHTAQAVRKAWTDIFPKLSEWGLRPDAARPVIERYKAQMVKEHRCEICVPIG